MDKHKKREVEWSFSFEGIGEKLEELGEHLQEKFGDGFPRFGAGDVEVKTASFSEPVGEATSARIALGGYVGHTTVEALGDSENLFEADLRYLGEIEFKAAGESEKNISLRHKGSNINMGCGWGRKLDLRTDVRLNPNIPLHLEIDGGVGKSKLDLSGLQLTGLNIDGGVGKTNLRLPAMDESYHVNIDVGVGANHIYISEGAAMVLNVDGGVGATVIYVPASAAVQIDVDGTLGGVGVPRHFKPMSGGKDFMTRSGAWQTQGFSEAERQIVIRFDGGVGKLVVRTEPKVEFV